MKLTGKTALITGAAQGIGLAIARAMAEAGAGVALCDINDVKVAASADQLRKEGHNVLAGRVDVTDLSSIKEMIQATADYFGELDIVVNSAGILSSSQVQDITEDEWDKILAVNLKGTFFVCQSAFPYLKDRPQPRIINLASLAGRMGGYESNIAYSASKGGIISMTYGLSRRYAPYGITVNSLCPGPTETPMIEQWSEEQVAGLLARIPIGKMSKPEHIAHAAVFLASDEAEVITGLALDINGGMYVG